MWKKEPELLLQLNTLSAEDFHVKYQIMLCQIYMQPQIDQCLKKKKDKHVQHLYESLFGGGGGLSRAGHRVS